MKKKIAALLCVCLALTSAVSCGDSSGDNSQNGSFVPNESQVIDKNKKQIYINVYGGGTGTKWITDEANKYNETLEEYQIYIQDEKREASYIIDEVNAASGVASAYFTVDIAFQELINTDKLVDLTSILNTTLEGENEKIGDKLTNKESWLKLASKNGSGCYLLPYCDSIGGLVFDYGDFVEKGWLNFADGNDSSVTAALEVQGIVYENNGGKLVYKSGGSVNYSSGDRILTAGKDGKYGTYDDGQPQTIAEWDRMLGKIKSTANCYPFIWPNKFENYTGMVQNAVFAQLAGVDGAENYFAFDSKGKEVEMHDGTKKVITVENGYEYFGMKEIYDTISFMATYFSSDNANPAVKENTNHTDVQKRYLFAPVSNGKIAESAMICEGIWWENEAKKGVFPQVEKQDADRGFGKRDYRFMLLPYMEGQRGIDGNGKGSVLAGQDTGSFFVVKEKDTKKTEILLDFLVRTLSDECLEKFTSETGIIRAYDYEISAENFAKMTPFAKTVWNIYRDTENIAIVRPFQDRVKEPIVYATTAGLEGVVFPYNDAGKIMGSDKVAVSWLSAGRSVDQIFKMVSGAFNQTSWTKLLDQARKQGFYA